MIKSFQELKTKIPVKFYNSLVFIKASLSSPGQLKQEVRPRMNFLDFLNDEFVESLAPEEKNKYTEVLAVLDGKGDLIGKANWLMVMKAQLYHGAVQMILVDTHKRKILLQKRSATVSDSLKWDISASGHIPAHHFKPSHILSQGLIETQEELGIPKKQLSSFQPISLPPYYYETEINHKTKRTFFFPIKVMVSAKNLILKPNPKEVVEIRWFSLNQILKIKKEDLAHGLKGLLEQKILRELIKN